MPNKIHAKEWLAYAQKDYDVALVLEQSTWPKFIEAICYHCQQATEKALKAILAYHDVKIRKIHEIDIILLQCQQYEPSIQMDVRIADQLTRFGTLTRYPDNVNEWTEDDARLALKYAKKTIQDVSEVLGI